MENTSSPRFHHPQAANTKTSDSEMLAAKEGPALPLPTADPLFETVQRAQEYLEASQANNTRDAYESDWRDFCAWCQQHGLASLPAVEQTVTLYMSALAETHAPSTLSRRLATITRMHQLEGFSSPARMRDNPQVAAILRGIRRTKGVAPKAKKPILLKDLVKMLDKLDGPIKAARDRALLLVGFASGMRCSELAAIAVEDLEWSSSGVTIAIHRSKTDQEQEGREVEIPLGSQRATCPASALQDWMRIAPIDKGVIFRRVFKNGKVGKEAMSPDSISRIVKRAMKASGVSGSKLKDYSGHSLRAGFATQASINGATELEIMQQTRHRSIAMVRRYIRDAKNMRLKAVKKLGL